MVVLVLQALLNHEPMTAPRFCTLDQACRGISSLNAGVDCSPVCMRQMAGFQYNDQTQFIPAPPSDTAPLLGWMEDGNDTARCSFWKEAAARGSQSRRR